MAQGRKRKAAQSAAGTETPEAATLKSGSRRRSGRLGSSAATTKSRYFDEDGENVEVQKTSKRARTGSSSMAQGSGIGRGKGSDGRRSAKKPAVRQEEEEDDDGDGDGDDDDDDDGDCNVYEDAYDADEPSQEEEIGKDSSDEKPLQNKTKGKTQPAGDDDDDDDEDDGDDENAPPKITFTPLPKMRDVGAVAYQDGRLHANTLLFLADLKANNRREWLKSNDGEFRRALKDWETFVETMTPKIIEADETVPELPFRDVNFRIYRDIRFSKSPLPYKTHFGAAWSRTGRKGPYACYYVHCEPGNCFVGGGLWRPDAAAMARLRASIDERPARWRAALTEPAFRRTWLPGAQAKGKETDDDDDDDDDGYRAAQKAFAEQNKNDALKTKPKGFQPDHRDIALLKLRNFTVTKKVPDSLFASDEGQARVAAYFEDLVGLVTHLNRIVMPDPGHDDSDED